MWNIQGIGTVYRCLKSTNQAQKKSEKHGRPRLIDARQEKKIQRTIARLREQEGNFSCHRIRAEATLHNVSLRTVNRTLKRMGYAFLEATKKGKLLDKDFRERLRFTCKVKRTYCNDFFMNDICFYLDGVSFYHKYNPLDDAGAPKGKIWRKKKGGTVCDCKGNARRLGRKIC